MITTCSRCGAKVVDPADTSCRVCGHPLPQGALPEALNVARRGAQQGPPKVVRLVTFMIVVVVAVIALAIGFITMGARQLMQ